MKNLLLTIPLLALGLVGRGQTPPKHLPPTVTLTAAQVIRLDSAIQTTARQVDSKTNTANFVNAFAPLYVQVEAEMVADSVKVKSKTTK